MLLSPVVRLAVTGVPLKHDTQLQWAEIVSVSAERDVESFDYKHRVNVLLDIRFLIRADLESIQFSQEVIGDASADHDDYESDEELDRERTTEQVIRKVLTNAHLDVINQLPSRDHLVSNILTGNQFQSCWNAVECFC